MKWSLLALAALVGVAGPAETVLAQKSADTLRFPVRRTEATLDPYINPGVFDNVWEPAIYDTLIAYDPKKRAFAPGLAKSWTQPSPTTYEFELREDILWHDGEKFDADDLVYFLGYLIDPQVKLRYKANWAWIEKVEKLGTHKIRITSKKPVPYALMWMAGSTYLFPEHKHAPLADKLDFGTAPVGTGPYRMTKFDKNGGLEAVKNPNFKPNVAKYAASIGKVVAEAIPDTGTLVAAMLIDKVDMALNLPADQALALQESGKFDVTLSPPGLEYTFFGFPTAGHKAQPALADIRVRQAIIHATNRQALIDVQFGKLNKGIKPHEHLCVPEQLGCGYTKAVPEYNPALAKKLLAEAGYANGFDVTVSCVQSRGVEAQAFAGMLRAVGIRATIHYHTTPQRVKLIQDGKVQIGYYGWSGGSIFEVTPVLGRHIFSEEYADAELRTLASGADQIMDDKQRRAHMAKAFDRIYEQAYAFAMLPSMATFTHSKDIKMKDVGVRATLVNPQDFEWK